MRTTLTKLQSMRSKGEKIAVLTCYDASFAALLEAQGVDVLLVGDSLGMVLQGHETTLPVTLDDMVYHTACVARGAKQAFILSDMPFGTFQISPQKAFTHAEKLMVAGAQMVRPLIPQFPQQAAEGVRANVFVEQLAHVADRNRLLRSKQRGFDDAFGFSGIEHGPILRKSGQNFRTG